MLVENYPKLTAILRGYSFDEAMTVIDILSEYHHKICVEVTTNNQDYLKIIKEANEQYGELIDIGVGTILNREQAALAIQHGAKFMLGPITFSKEIITLAKNKGVVSVPGAFSPSEVHQMKSMGADIIKIFPASTVGPAYFKDIQSPLGKLNLMAVGGINQHNAKEYLDSGASYVGIGSALFNMDDLRNGELDKVRQSIEAFLKCVE